MNGDQLNGGRLGGSFRMNVVVVRRTTCKDARGRRLACIAAAAALATLAMVSRELTCAAVREPQTRTCHLTDDLRLGWRRV